MFWGKRAQQREAVNDARRASLHLGAVIYGQLKDPDVLGVDEYMTLRPEEFQALRMFAKDERPDIVLDCVWHVHEGAEVYRVRLDWDIRQITAIS